MLHARCQGSIEAFRNVSGSTQRLPHRHDFLFYSPLGEKGLVTINAEGTAHVGSVSPFWAGLLTDRENQDLVNMMPHQEAYKLLHPVATLFTLKYPVNMKVSVPFLAHSVDLVPGQLLVLPFDGGCANIFSAPPSLSASSSGYEPTVALP